MHTGKQKQMNASYQASLVNRHIRRFTGLYHMSLDRTNMDSIDRPNFDLLKEFFDSSSDEENNGKIKSFIEASRTNRDVRMWYKQCITRK